MTYIGYSELTKKFYLLPRSKKESKVDITDDVKEILAAFEKPSPEVNVEELVKALNTIIHSLGVVNFSSHHQMREAIEESLSLADSAIAGYNAALNKGGGE